MPMRRARNYLLFLALLSLVCVFRVSADERWNEYDAEWINRSAQTRLQLLERAISHYARALDHYKKKNFKKAEVYAKDALKVEPRFSEALYLRSLIFKENEDFEREEAFREKSYAAAREVFVSVLEEQQYLAKNIERLQKIHAPSMAFHRFMIFFFICIAAVLLIFLLSATDTFLTFSMRMRQLIRISSDKEEREIDSPLIVGEFLGDEKGRQIPWFVYVGIYTACFVFCFVVTHLAGIESRKEYIVYSLLSSAVLSFLIYHIFFSDSEFEGPQKFGRFR